MALPTTIGSTTTQAGHDFLGPFLSGGNVYCVLTDNSGVNRKVHVYKATDPTTSFSEQDSANVPAQTGVNDIWARLDGNVLSLVTATNSVAAPDYRFHQFSTATDTWSATIKDKAILNPNTVSNIQHACVKRSDGSFIVILGGAKELLMGVNRDRTSYSKSTDGGSTWSAETAIGATGVKRDIYVGTAILGASDRTHFFYSDTLANTKHRSLSSADALDTEAAVTTTGNIKDNYDPGVSYVSGANTVVKVPVWDTTNSKLTNVFFNSAANPSISTNVDFTDATVLVGAGNVTIIGCAAVDGTTVHCVWSDATSKDLEHDSQPDGGAWGTDVNEWAATINTVSANIYTRSGNKVLAVLVDDGGTVKYNEITLAAAVDIVNMAIFRPRLRSY